MAAMVGLGVSAMAQTSGVHKTYEVNTMSDQKEAADASMITDKADRAFHQMKGDGPPAFYEETFSNGLAGENGAWTTDGAQGDLWFQTFPLGAPDGYDPNVINSPAYIALPSYFGTQTTVVSETAANGFMMLDADAFNSLKLTPEDPPAGTDNPIEAFLVSPSIDMTGATNGAIKWTQKYRMCCFNYALYVDMSFDGGANWTEAWIREDATGNQVYETTTIHNVTDLINGASDLSDVKIRFRWPYNAPDPGNGATNSHYYWMIDDVSIMVLPDNDLVLGDAAYNNWLALHSEWEADPSIDYDYVKGFEYYRTPKFLGQPMNFVAVVSNTGAMPQTEVGIKATVTDPDGVETIFTTPMEDRITMEPGDVDTLQLMGQMIPTGYINGDYSVAIEVIQAEEDFNPVDNVQTRTFVIDENDIYSVPSGAGSSPVADNDYIIGQRYFFPQNTDEGMQTVITGVEFVLYNTGNEGFITTEGVLLYGNVRKGSLWSDDTTSVEFQPENPLTYDPIETIYITAEEDMTSSTVVWAGMDFMTELGEPIAVPVDDNQVYQAEFRVPNLGQGSEVASALQPNKGNGALIIDGISGDDPGWGSFAGKYAASVRFKTASVTEVKNVSFDYGIQLFQNFPNPFNNESKVNFKLPSASKVSVEIHDIQGRLVSSEDLGTLPQGVSEYYINAKGMSAGVYTYTLVTDLGSLTRKMTIK